jgi:hypothetical protein
MSPSTASVAMGSSASAPTAASRRPSSCSRSGCRRRRFPRARRRWPAWRAVTSRAMDRPPRPTSPGGPASGSATRAPRSRAPGWRGREPGPGSGARRPGGWRRAFTSCRRTTSTRSPTRTGRRSPRRRCRTRCAAGSSRRSWWSTGRWPGSGAGGRPRDLGRAGGAGRRRPSACAGRRRREARPVRRAAGGPGGQAARSASAGRISPASRSILSAASPSPRVGPRLTMAIGMPRSAARRTNR